MAKDVSRRHGIIVPKDGKPAKKLTNKHRRQIDRKLSQGKENFKD